MYFHEAEVVELGPAEDLIQEDFDLVSSEAPDKPQRIKTFLTIYAADAE
jgi:hypothetical protein